MAKTMFTWHFSLTLNHVLNPSHCSNRALGLLASHLAECPVAGDNEPHPLDFLMQTLQFPLASNSGTQRMCASLILSEWANSQLVITLVGCSFYTLHVQLTLL